MNLSVVVPCFNEAKNIPFLLRRFEECLRDSKIKAELVLVNNGSLDETQKILDENLGSFNFARSVKIEKNIGYGNGILRGLESAKGEVLCYAHADLQTDLKDAFRAFEIFQKKQDSKLFVKGTRKGRGAFDNFFTLGMSAFESLYLGQKLWDINAQPNLFCRDFFDSIKVGAPLDFSLDLYFLYMARRLGYGICRFDVAFPKRQHGASSWNTGLGAKYKFIKRTIEFSLKLKRSLNGVNKP